MKNINEMYTLHIYIGVSKNDTFFLFHQPEIESLNF